MNYIDLLGSLSSGSHTFANSSKPLDLNILNSPLNLLPNFYQNGEQTVPHKLCRFIRLALGALKRWLFLNNALFSPQTKKFLLLAFARWPASYPRRHQNGLLTTDHITVVQHILVIVDISFFF